MSVLVRNGTVVTAAEKFRADLLCVEGRIAAIAPSISPPSGCEVVDAEDHLVFPGGIDPHVHMELPFMGTVSADDFETGTAAGLAGGTTSIIDFVIPARGESPLQALSSWHAKAKKAKADYTFHMAITWWGDQTERWMTECVREQGVTSFKVFLAYRGAIGIDDTELIRVMRTAAKLGAIVLVHAEHGEMVVDLQTELFNAGKIAPKYHALSRPPVVEGEATGRALLIARMTGATAYIVHMTCREAVQALAQARAAGQKAYGETCPQYLLLDDSVYEKPDFEGAAYVMSPPIRPLGHQEDLWAALSSGTLQIVGTDHCPFNQAQKKMGESDFRKIPNGGPGIEDRLALLWTHGVETGRIDAHQFVDLTSTRPAKIFGLHPRKGSITVGADADLVVWNPAATRTISAKTHHHRCDRSIFEGFRVKGAPSVVLSGGRIAVREGNVLAERGAGRFLARRIS